VINKAEWCKVCKLYEVRAISAFNENNQDSYFQFLENDITNDSTKLKSKPEIEKFGLEKMMKKNTNSGVLSFYDAKTKKLLIQVTVAISKTELAANMQLVREKAVQLN
jgi:thiol:disulfide interchange protein